MTSTDRLVKALEDNGAPESMIEKAKAGMYNDVRSTLAFPITALVRDCDANDLKLVAVRALAGEFDATDEEWDEWIKDGSLNAWLKGREK